MKVVEAILDGRDAIGIMPTGGGKSLCYQFPAILSDGVTLVISPLISLMADQVSSLVGLGIPSAFLNSSLSAQEYWRTMNEARRGGYKILYIAPERLDTEPFLELASVLDVSMVAVDEAHCISQWGQNFRPSYLKIADFIGRMKRRPVVSAFTATATMRVREDIISRLRLRNPLVEISGFDRENLYFEVRKPENKNRELMSILAGRKTKNGIVYCSTRKSVESVHELLLRNGLKATRYHAGLSDEERKKNQDDFLYDRMSIMVATNAFGMGIDKSNVHFIVHYNMPKNIESYYQEAGRAGRDGSDAECFLLYSPTDHRTNQFLIEKSIEENPDLDDSQRAELLEKDMLLLKEMTFYAFTDGCLRRFILKYFGDESRPYCGNCGSCLLSFEEVDATSCAISIIYCVHQINAKGWPFGKTMVADVLKGSQSEKILKSGLNRIEKFAALSDVPRQRILSIIDHLVQDGYLSVTGDKYPVLALGKRARECVAPGFEYIVKTPKAKDPPPKAVKAGKQAEAEGGAGGPGSEELFEELRKVRAGLAAEARIPAYVVFHDSTLREMCRLQPTDEESFMLLSGVGKAKLERYGKRFLDAIRSYRQKERPC